MSEVCNRKCAMCGNWTRGTEGVVCDLCVEVMNKSLNLSRKDSKMSEKVKISVKCENCGNRQTDFRYLAFLSPTLICCECGHQAEVKLDFQEAEGRPEPAPEQSGMTFMEAVEAMKEEKSVKRAKHAKMRLRLETDWDGYIKTYVPGKGLRDWVPSVADFEATDWEIVK